MFGSRKPKNGDRVTVARNTRGAKAGDKIVVSGVREGLILGHYVDGVDSRGRRRRGIDGRDVVPE